MKNKERILGVLAGLVLFVGFLIISNKFTVKPTLELNDLIEIYSETGDVNGEHLTFEVLEVVESPLVGKSLFIHDNAAVITRGKELEVNAGDHLTVVVDEVNYVLGAYMITYTEVLHHE